MNCDEHFEKGVIMTLDQLNMVEKIVETGSILAASKALNMSQPAVSVAVKKLEEELELKIFTREQYRTTLTPEGEALYKKSKLILSHVDSLQHMAEKIVKGEEAEIRIAIDIGCPFSPVFEALKHIEQEFPHTGFNFSTESLGGSFEKLMNGTVHFALLPQGIDTYKQAEPLFVTKIDIGPVAAPFFPAAQTKSKLSREEMRKYVQILVKDTSVDLPKMDYAVVEGARHWRVSDIFMKKQMILSGLGWGGMPYHLVEEELRDGRLIPLQIEDIEKSSCDMVLTRKRNQPIGPVAQKLWEYFLNKKQE